MNNQIRKELPPALARHVEALHQPPDATAVEAAQHRLTARLKPADARRGSRSPRWVVAATTAVIALVAVVAIPMLGEGGRAFAAVQRHFTDFDLLSMQVEQRMGGRVVQSSRMVVDRQGTLRTDIGDRMSVIVDPGRERMLTLLHEPRRAMLVPLHGAEQSPAAALDWLAEIREFQGEATLMPGTRLIDGREARGWSLHVEGQGIVLWADADGLPLAMEMGGAGGMEIHYAFDFDPQLAPGHLRSEAPAGYTLVGPDGD